MRKSRLVVWLKRATLALVVLGVIAGGYFIDRMAVRFITGPRQGVGRDAFGADVRRDGPVPGFAFLGMLRRSETPAGLEVLRPFDTGRAIGLKPGDVITSVDGKLYESGQQLVRDFLQSHAAGDAVSLIVRDPDGAERQLTLVLEPLLRTPRDLGLPYEDVEIPSDSGFTLRGWLIPPPPTSDGRAGVFVHGTRSSRYQGLRESAAHWYRRGYGLLLLDLSGRGESGGKYETYTLNERKDVASALRWLRARPEVSPERAVLFGTSNGAASAIYAAAEDRALPALALDAPYSDLWLEAGEMLRAFGMSPLLRYPLAVAIRVRAGVNIREVRPIDAITNIRASVLFIHGDRDETVPPYHSERLHKARLDAGLPTERWLLPGGEHGFDNYPPGEEFWNRVMDFYDRALGGPAAPAPAPGETLH